MNNSWYIIISPLLAGLLAQTIKFFIRSNGQHFNLKKLAVYSGMPSGHSAMVTALCASVALSEGADSPLFAISLILAIIVIRDALGIRQYLGQHGHILNLLVKELKQDDILDGKYPHLLERIGHTPAQVLVGSAIGIGIAIILHYLPSLI